MRPSFLCTGLVFAVFVPVQSGVAQVRVQWQSDVPSYVPLSPSFAQASGPGRNGDRQADSNSDTDERYTAFENRIARLLDQPIGQSIRQDTMERVLNRLGVILGVPVVVRPEPWLEIGPILQQRIELPSSGIPLRAALKSALRPHRLTIAIADDALWVIPDAPQLAAQGKGLVRYSRVSPNFMERFSKMLATPIDLPGGRLSLIALAEHLTRETKIPFQLDIRSLEDLGLSGDLSLEVGSHVLSLESTLAPILESNELSLRVFEGTVFITTIESAEDPANALVAVHWLDGTGISNVEMAMDLIQTAVAPDTWEFVGGPSTMFPLQSPSNPRFGQFRVGVVIASTFEVHRMVEKLARALRETHLDPSVQITPAQRQNQYQPW